MKKIIILIAVLSFAKLSSAQELDVNLKVDGILSAKGQLLINIFDSESQYLKEPVKSIKVDLTQVEGYNFEIKGLSKGEYAIAVVHDENNNGQLDFGGMGPEEGYGFSNNPNAMYGPAPYSSARIMLEESATLTIELN